MKIPHIKSKNIILASQFLSRVRCFQECESQPCLNAGFCVDLVDKYACICAKGYSGTQCEVDLDACLDMPVNSSQCFNGGTCLDGPGYSFTCR